MHAKHYLKRIFLPLLAGLMLAGQALPGAAQGSNYPDRPIRLVVPFAPGGTTDAVARAVAAKMGLILGQSIVVDNKAGAGGSIGTDYVAKAPPDGYTLLLGSSGPLSVNPSLYPKLPYDSLKDFSPVGLICTSALVLVAYPGARLATTADLIKAARAAPDTLTYSTAGVGGASHIAAELFSLNAGIRAVHVPYRGSGPATVAAVAGETTYTFTGQTAAWPMVEAGKLVALGIASARRSPEHPNVPTVAEAGLAGFEAADWDVLMAPPGTPLAVLARLDDALRKVLADPDLKAGFVKQGIEIQSGTPAQVNALIRADIAKWARVIRSANIHAE